MKDSMKKLIVPLLASAAVLAMATGVAQAQQKKTIALVTNVAADSWNARERVQGIKEAITGTKVELVDVFTDQVDFAKAKANMENVLVKYPDIALLSGLWSYETPLIYDAVKAAGKVGTVKIVGFDEDQRTLRGISDGTIESTVVQQRYELGYLSATNIIKMLNGDNSSIA